MTNITEYITIALKKYDIGNHQLALWILTVSKDLLQLELALRECEAHMLGRFERFDNPHIRIVGLPEAEGVTVDIIDNKTVRIEFIYGQNSPEPDICELPLFLYKALLYDYYNSIKPDNFYPNGQILYIGQSHNFLRYGIWTEFYSNGQVKSKGEYVNSQKVGKWICFFEKGQNKAVELYDDNGYRCGLWETWYESGQLKWKSFFKNNEYSGDSFYWYENGQLASHTIYTEKNKRKDGEHKTWWENGNLKTVTVEKNERTIEYRYYDINGNLEGKNND
jgi:antitoxin component YwqK of YwqJK toxin-antitoxin module